MTSAYGQDRGRGGGVVLGGGGGEGTARGGGRRGGVVTLRSTLKSMTSRRKSDMDGGCWVGQLTAVEVSIVRMLCRCKR